MRYLRSRLRSSIFFVLSTMIFYSLFTLHSTLWSTVQIEQQKPILEHPKSSIDVSIWSALNQQNIYDVKATQSNRLTNHSSYITSYRIHELFQLVRHARIDHIHSLNIKKSYSYDSTRNIEKFIEQNSQISDNERIYTTNLTNISNIKFKLNSTLTAIETNKYDKIRLRHYIHYVINKWKQHHINDKTITLADVMHNSLAENEPS